MKLYDTINGTFVSDTEIEIPSILSEISLGEFSDKELDNLTIEGSDQSQSISLRDLSNLKGYCYFSGGNGTVIACSDGRHADTVSGSGCSENGAIFSHEDVEETLETLSNEMDEVTDAPIPEIFHNFYNLALEYARNCVDFEIEEKYGNDTPGSEYCVRHYVGDTENWIPKESQ